MNWWLLFFTFCAVNLDFFVMLLFLLNRYRTRDVIVGYVSGLTLLLVASFFIGRLLRLFLPEWILGVLGVLPIYMALHDNDEGISENGGKNPIITTLITYLAVCAGCNLSIFLPVLTGLTSSQFVLVILFIIILGIGAVVLVKLIGKLPIVERVMNRYSEILMKIIYIGVGLYVFWDSKLISHLWTLLV